MSTICGDVVGPVWKLDGESWICNLPAGHKAAGQDHAVIGDRGLVEICWTDDHPEKTLRPR